MKINSLEKKDCIKHIILLFLLIISWNISCVNSSKSPGVNLGTNKIIDERDNQDYEVVGIGNQKWMASNLNYETPSSYCYDNEPKNCKKSGRLYNYKEALNVCPKGWQLPTDKDWKTLEANLGMKETSIDSIRVWRGEKVGNLMKEQLKVILSGVGSSKGRNFEGENLITRFWSRTNGPSGEQFAIFRMLMKGKDNVYSDQIPKMNLCCIRCIEEK